MATYIPQIGIILWVRLIGRVILKITLHGNFRERLHASYPNNKIRHDLTKDLHVFGSYVTGHLPRTHPFVVDTTHDDRAVEGVWLGNDLCTPNFWMYSFAQKGPAHVGS